MGKNSPFFLILWVTYSIKKEEGQKIIKSINQENSTLLHCSYFNLKFLDNFASEILKHTSYFFESHYMIKC